MLHLRSINHNFYPVEVKRWKKLFDVESH